MAAQPIKSLGLHYPNDPVSNKESFAAAVAKYEQKWPYFPLRERMCYI